MDPEYMGAPKQSQTAMQASLLLGTGAFSGTLIHAVSWGAFASLFRAKVFIICSAHLWAIALLALSSIFPSSLFPEMFQHSY